MTFNTDSAGLLMLLMLDSAKFISVAPTFSELQTPLSGCLLVASSWMDVSNMTCPKQKSWLLLPEPLQPWVFPMSENDTAVHP